MMAKEEMVQRIAKELKLIQENKGTPLHIILEKEEKKKLYNSS